MTNFLAHTRRNREGGTTRRRGRRNAIWISCSTRRFEESRGETRARAFEGARRVPVARFLEDSTELTDTGLKMRPIYLKITKIRWDRQPSGPRRRFGLILRAVDGEASTRVYTA
jgi:hypothetical protein